MTHNPLHEQGSGEVERGRQAVRTGVGDQESAGLSTAVYYSWICLEVQAYFINLSKHALLQHSTTL